MDCIGILNLQGGVVEHADHLARIGIEAVLVRKPEDLQGLKGLIIPGGESTCLHRLVRLFNLEDAIVQASRNGTRLWGTCAGAILLATTVVDEGSKLGLIDITVQRNAFGSQLDSFSAEAVVPAVSPSPVPLTFIRAPQITAVGEDVRILLELESYIAMAENQNVLVSVFHPELTPCLAFHRYFALKCGLTPTPASTTESDTDRTWQRTSWTRHLRP